METATNQGREQLNVDHDIALLGHTVSNLFELVNTSEDYGCTTFFTHLEVAVDHILKAALELERLSKLPAAESRTLSDS